MFSSSIDNKTFSLANIIEEQLGNISLGGSSLGLESDNNDLNLDGSESQAFSSASLKTQQGDSCTSQVDRIVSCLACSEVRWFYKNSNKTWIEFGGYDTLQLETAYSKLPPELQTANNTKAQPKSPTYVAFKQTIEERRENCATSPQILVRGGLYEVDLLVRSGSSIYWPGEEFIVTRGTWFYEATWQPLEEDHANALEKTHLKLFQGKKSSEYSLDTQAKILHSEVFPDFHVDWYSPDEVYLYSQATPSKIVRSFTQKLGGYFHKSTGSRLLRGYKEAATDNDKPLDISHLVFVVHGIGQKMNIGAQIFRNTSFIREKVTVLKEKYFPGSSQRVEFFPVEWRSSLTLDGGTVDAITPLHVKMLRQVLNSSAMDIMYYTSPIYCSEIQDELCAEMNRLYRMFTERNCTKTSPKVSVIAHSLGAVIVYDIVTGWLPMMSMNEGVLLPGKSRLNFELDNFFCLGSPLSVFLAVRVPKGQHGYHLFPPSLCNRLYNIYHLTDPVAYRLEPLIVKDYARISPLVIHPYNAVRPTPYSEMPLEPLDMEPFGSMGVSGTTNLAGNAQPGAISCQERGWSIWNLVRGASNKCPDNAGSPHYMDSPTQGLEHRLDYVLTSGAVGPLVVRSVLISHTAYWSNYDVAYFVLTRIFPELELTATGSSVAASSTSPLSSTSPSSTEEKDSNLLQQQSQSK
ncbi:hypothetical protein AAG570_009307 [Ranatra chinensis]|uniref:DDHD domain-containing protein n=1 Tax=Ranatra chinensis TaxID=642074 RepID=A0ABD0YNP9_9HEMI